METLIKLLMEVNDSYDYTLETELFSQRKLDSFDLVGLITGIREEFDVTIPAHLIRAENFDSAASILELIVKLQKGEANVI